MTQKEIYKDLGRTSKKNGGYVYLFIFLLYCFRNGRVGLSQNKMEQELANLLQLLINPYSLENWDKKRGSQVNVPF